MATPPDEPYVAGTGYRPPAPLKPGARVPRGVQAILTRRAT
jgi:hypothetical protein